MSKCPSPAGQYGTRGLKAQIEDRSKVSVETQRARFQAQDFAMHPEQLAIASGKARR